MQHLIRGLLIGTALLYPQFVSALTISPPLIELVAKPGELISRQVRVYNESRGVVRVIPELAHVRFDETSNVPTVITPPEVSTEEDLISWIERPAAFSLGSGEWSDVSFSLEIPPFAKPGTQAAALLFGAVPESPPPEGIGLIGKTGPVVLVTVEGDQAVKISPVEFRFPGGEVSVFDSMPLEFSVKLKNEGLGVVVPRGFISVRNIFGQEVHQFEFNRDGLRILPGIQRTFMVHSARGSVSGIRREWQPPALGRYTATLAISDSDEKMSLVYWVVPWRSLGSGAALLILFVGILKLWRRV